MHHARALRRALHQRRTRMTGSKVASTQQFRDVDDLLRDVDKLREEVERQSKWVRDAKAQTIQPPAKPPLS